MKTVCQTQKMNLLNLKRRKDKIMNWLETLDWLGKVVLILFVLFVGWAVYDKIKNKLNK